MANKLTIQHKRSSVGGSAPTAADIAIGELAINFADAKLFTKDGGGNIIELGGGTDTYTTAAAIDANNLVTFTLSDGSTHTLDLDNIWLSLADGGTVAGNTIFNGQIQTPTAPTANNDITNKKYVDDAIAAAEVYTSSAAMDANGVLTQTRTDTTTYTVDVAAALDPRYVNVDGDTMTGVLIAQANVQVQGTLIANNTTLKLGDLADVDPAAPTDGQVLTWDAANSEWVPSTLPSGTTDTFVSGGAFDSTNGEITLSINDGSQVKFLIDGRYVVAPASANTGEVLSWNGTAWMPIAATVDTFVNAAAWDAATETLTLTRNDSNTVTVNIPSVDTFINAGAFDTSNGNLTLTRSDGNTVVFSMDGRYLLAPASANTGQVLTWNGTAWAAANNDHTVDTFVNAATWNANTDTLTLTRNDGNTVTVVIPEVDTFVNAGAFDTSNGNLTLTRNDGNTVVFSMDGRYFIAPSTANTGEVLMWNGSAWVANTSGGSNWTVETSGISRADRIKVGANADPLVAVDVIGTVGQNAQAGPAIDASTGQVWTIDASASPTVSITGTIPQSTTLVLVVTGSGTVTWPTILWPSGTAPTLSGGSDVITLFTADAGTTWYGNSFALDAQ